MNTQNIIQEGFFDDLLRAIIPQSIQDRIDKPAKEKLKKQLEKSNKKIQDLEKQSKVLKNIVKDKWVFLKNIKVKKVS